jgi:hypothetical protein
MIRHTPVPPTMIRRAKPAAEPKIAQPNVPPGLRPPAECWRGKKDRVYYTAAKALKAWLGGKGFVPHPSDLLSSPAWRRRSIYLARLIDLLEADYLAHAGRENGFLRATVRQMMVAGIPARRIAPTVAEGEALGLLTVTHLGSYAGGAKSNPRLFKLNYLPFKVMPTTGSAPAYYLPTDEWRLVEKQDSMTSTGRAINATRGEHSATSKEIVRFHRKSKPLR